MSKRQKIQVKQREQLICKEPADTAERAMMGLEKSRSGMNMPLQKYLNAPTERTRGRLSSYASLES